MRGIKQTNDYVTNLGRAYAETPKAVWAALAWALAYRLGEELPDRARALLESEWSTLHAQGIVPQEPARSLYSLK